MKIGNIECDKYEETVYKIADKYTGYMNDVYEKENREFNRENYLVYYTYFVFITRAAIGGLTKKDTRYPWQSGRTEGRQRGLS